MGGLQAIFQLDMPIFIYDNTPQGKKQRKKTKENMTCSYWEQFYSYSELTVKQQYNKDFKKWNVLNIACHEQEQQNLLECQLGRKAMNFAFERRNRYFMELPVYMMIKWGVEQHKEIGASQI